MNISDDAILHIGPGGRIYDADGVDVTYELNKEVDPGQLDVIPWDGHTLKLGGWGTTTTSNKFIIDKDPSTVFVIEDEVQPWTVNFTTHYTSSYTNASKFTSVDNNTITYQTSMPVTKTMVDEASTITLMKESLKKKKNKLKNKVGKDWSYKYNNTYE
jgi:hypothetical protein